MNLKEFLENNKIINTAELARVMFADKRTAPQYLNHKLKGTITAPGRAPQQITAEDVAKAKEVLLSILKEVENIK